MLHCASPLQTAEQAREYHKKSGAIIKQLQRRRRSSSGSSVHRHTLSEHELHQKRFGLEALKRKSSQV